MAESEPSIYQKARITVIVPAVSAATDATERAQCVVFVAATESYEDLLPAFSFYWTRYWPDCPFPVYFASRLVPAWKGSGAAPLGRWGGAVRLALKCITAPFVLLVMPDYLLEAPVDGRAIVSHLQCMIEHEAGYLRLMAAPQPARSGRVVGGDVSLVQLEQTELYSTSLMPAFWDRLHLLALLSDTDDPWSFERLGRLRRPSAPLHFTVSVSQIRIAPTGALVRGKWTRASVRRLHRDGVAVDTSQRGVMTLRSACLQTCKAAVFNATLPVVRAVDRRTRGQCR